MGIAAWSRDHAVVAGPGISAVAGMAELPAPLQLAHCAAGVCAIAFVNIGSAWSLQRDARPARSLQARHPRSAAACSPCTCRASTTNAMRAACSSALHRHGITLPVAHDADWVAVAAVRHRGLADRGADRRQRPDPANASSATARSRDLDARVARRCRAVRWRRRRATPIELRRRASRRCRCVSRSAWRSTPQYLYVADSGHHRVLECNHAGRVLRAVRQRRRRTSSTADRTGGVQPPARPVPAARHAVRRRHRQPRGAPHQPAQRRRRHAVRQRPAPATPIEGAGRAIRARSRWTSRAPWRVANDQLLHRAAPATTGSGATTSGKRALQLPRRLRRAGGAATAAATTAAFAQPVALAAVQQTLYVCDAAGSAIRALQLRDHAGHDAGRAGPVALRRTPTAPRSDRAAAGSAGHRAGSRRAAAVDRRQPATTACAACAWAAAS